MSWRSAAEKAAGVSGPICREDGFARSRSVRGVGGGETVDADPDHRRSPRAALQPAITANMAATVVPDRW